MNDKIKKETVLDVQNIAVGYHGKALISGISCRIHRGEILTLIGPNGAGKSTILKSLTKQLQLISGNIALCGKDLQSLAPSAVAEKMAVLLTERVKEGYLTAFDVAAMGRYPYTGKMGILSEKDRKITKEALEAAEAYDLAERPYAELSDGQKQRVLLARALAQEPEVLILDEPTTYLDIRYQMTLMDLLRDLSRRKNVTVVLSLHEIGQAARISDRVILVQDDRTCRIGTPEEIFRGKEIEDLFHLEKGRYDPLLGDAELKKPEGEPEIFVISSGGTGIPVYRRLLRQRIPFAAGILYENDLDTRFARLMANEVIMERPFVPISDQTFSRAVICMKRCRKVINAGIEIGEENQKILDLIQMAEEEGKVISQSVIYQQ